MLNDISKVKSFKDIDLNTHISLKNNYVFFQVSKVASSTVKEVLQRFEVEGTARKVINVNDRYVSPHVWPSQLDQEVFVSILEDPSYRKLSFVRNPYTRILSCYLHRIVKDVRSPSNRYLESCTGGLCGPEISFKDFVKVVCEQPSFSQESHWRRQTDEILYDFIPNWDFIGRFESLSQDISIMTTLIKYGHEFSFDENLNKSPMSTGASSKLKKYFDDETQQIVYESYKADFLNFGYSKDL